MPLKYMVKQLQRFVDQAPSLFLSEERVCVYKIISKIAYFAV